MKTRNRLMVGLLCGCVVLLFAFNAGAAVYQASIDTSQLGKLNQVQWLRAWGTSSPTSEDLDNYIKNCTVWTLVNGLIGVENIETDPDWNATFFPTDGISSAFYDWDGSGANDSGDIIYQAALNQMMAGDLNLGCGDDCGITTDGFVDLKRDYAQTVLTPEEYSKFNIIPQLKPTVEWLYQELKYSSVIDVFLGDGPYFAEPGEDTAVTFTGMDFNTEADNPLNPDVETDNADTSGSDALGYGQFFYQSNWAWSELYNIETDMWLEGGDLYIDFLDASFFEPGSTKTYGLGAVDGYKKLVSFGVAQRVPEPSTLLLLGTGLLGLIGYRRKEK